MKRFVVKTSTRPFFTCLVVIATLLGIGTTRAARADVVTFAQFNQQAVADQDFAYTNRGTSVSFNSLAQGIPIFLTITSGFAPNLDRLQSAHLFLTSSTAAATLPPASPDDFLRQHFTGGGNLIQVLLDSPVNGKNNFLTVTFSDGLFSGRLNATEASLKASDTDSGTPSQVSFLSDFIDFSGADEHGFSLSFSSVNSNDRSGFLQMGDNGFFRSFTSSGTGTFDTRFAAAPVPEPSSIILALLGFLSLAGTYKYRRGR